MPKSRSWMTPLAFTCTISLAAVGCGVASPSSPQPPSVLSKTVSTGAASSTPGMQTAMNATVAVTAQGDTPVTHRDLEVVGPQTFTNTRFGYTFQVPAGWVASGGSPLTESASVGVIPAKPVSDLGVFVHVCRGFAVCPQTNLSNLSSQESSSPVSLGGLATTRYTYSRTTGGGTRVWDEIHTVAQRDGWTIDAFVDLPIGQSTVPQTVTDLLNTWHWTSGASAQAFCGAEPTSAKDAPIQAVSGAKYSEIYLRTAHSVWLDGAVAIDTCNWAPLAVSTDYNAAYHRPVILVGAVGSPEQWIAPRDLGEITITGATGPQGSVSFTSASGVKGTCDLVHHTWAFS